MIFGLGCDLVDVLRIEKLLNKSETAFLERIFSAREIADIKLYQTKSPLALSSRVAKMFAAKEACAKALGTGFGQDTFWQEIEVYHLPSGQPAIKLLGKTYANFTAKIKTENFAVHLSLSDEKMLAQAVVIIDICG